jgi:hypothetical protein
VHDITPRDSCTPHPLRPRPLRIPRPPTANAPPSLAARACAIPPPPPPPPAPSTSSGDKGRRRPSWLRWRSLAQASRSPTQLAAPQRHCLTVAPAAASSSVSRVYCRPGARVRPKTDHRRRQFCRTCVDIPPHRPDAHRRAQLPWPCTRARGHPKTQRFLLNPTS